MSTPSYSPGAFCWNELGTIDPDAARKFYAELIGWNVTDVPMPDGAGTYSLLKVGDGDVAGLYKLEGPQFEGVPSHWLSYVWTNDVDASIAQVEKLGGRMHAPAIDVPGVGRIAVAADPTGATFALFQGKEHPGAAQLGQVPGTFCWNELMTTDVDAATNFYTSLFGYSANVQEMGMGPYTMLMLGDHPAGGLMAMPKEMAGVPSHWMTYITVADCDATASKAAELGGKVLAPPMDIPTIGRFACLQDPTGASVSVIKLESPST